MFTYKARVLPTVLSLRPSYWHVHLLNVEVSEGRIPIQGYCLREGMGGAMGDAVKGPGNGTMKGAHRASAESVSNHAQTKDLEKACVCWIFGGGGGGGEGSKRRGGGKGGRAEEKVKKEEGEGREGGETGSSGTRRCLERPEAWLCNKTFPVLPPAPCHIVPIVPYVPIVQLLVGRGLCWPGHPRTDRKVLSSPPLVLES